MKVDDTTLRHLLSGEKQFVIPLFQRQYTWSKDDWEELWRDLQEIYIQENRRKHFVGAIVTMPVDIQPHGIDKYLLIDGQQRLTTLLIMLACIRDIAYGADQDLSERIEKLYMTNQFEKNANRLKLLPTFGDKEAFRQIAERKQRTASPIARVYDFYLKAIELGDLDEKPIELEKLFDSVMNQLIFVSITIEKGESPYRIFHSLNGTGQDLTQADLVRNFLFMHTTQEVVAQKIIYEEYWLPMQARLGKELGNYLWRFVAKDGEVIRQKGVYDEIRSRVSHDNNPKLAAQSMLEDMHMYSEFYHKMLNPSLEKEPKLKKRLDFLKQWDFKTPYPLLLNLYNELKNDAIRIEEFCAVMDAVESYVVRRFFCGLPIRPMTNHFIRMYKSIRDASNIVESAYDYLTSRDFPDDNQFFEAWTRFSLYPSAKKSKHILVSLETKLNTTKEFVDTATATITQEHIMPQTLNADWRVQLGDDAELVHSQYLHTIGNLTLTGQNPTLGNKPFSEKRLVFQESNFTLNEYFDDTHAWDKKAILRRARSLGKVALQIWGRSAE